MHVAVPYDMKKPQKAKLYWGSWSFTTLCETNVWWSRWESNPRPKVLYEEFYMLSLANWI